MTRTSSSQIHLFVDGSANPITGAAAYAVVAQVPGGSYRVVRKTLVERWTPILEVERLALLAALESKPAGSSIVIHSDCQDAIFAVRAELQRDTVLLSGPSTFLVQLLWRDRCSDVPGLMAHEAASGLVRAESDRLLAELDQGQEGDPYADPPICVSLAHFQVDSPGLPPSLLAALIDRRGPQPWESSQELLIEPLDGDLLPAISCLLDRAGLLDALEAGALELRLDPSVPDLGAAADLVETRVRMSASVVDLSDHDRNMLVVGVRRIADQFGPSSPQEMEAEPSLA